MSVDEAVRTVWAEAGVTPPTMQTSAKDIERVVRMLVERIDKDSMERVVGVCRGRGAAGLRWRHALGGRRRFVEIGKTLHHLPSADQIADAGADQQTDGKAKKQVRARMRVIVHAFIVCPDVIFCIVCGCSCAGIDDNIWNFAKRRERW